MFLTEKTDNGIYMIKNKIVIFFISKRGTTKNIGISTDYMFIKYSCCV